jgi:hypothetical protein
MLSWILYSVLFCQYRRSAVALIASAFRRTSSGAWAAQELQDFVLRAANGFHPALERFELTVKSLLLFSW